MPDVSCYKVCLLCFSFFHDYLVKYPAPDISQHIADNFFRKMEFWTCKYFTVLPCNLLIQYRDNWAIKDSSITLPGIEFHLSIAETSTFVSMTA